MNDTITATGPGPPVVSLTYEQVFLVLLGGLAVLVCVLFGLIIYVEEQSNKRRQSKHKKVHPNEII